MIELEKLRAMLPTGFDAIVDWSGAILHLVIWGLVVAALLHADHCWLAGIVIATRSPGYFANCSDAYRSTARWLAHRRKNKGNEP